MKAKRCMVGVDIPMGYYCSGCIFFDVNFMQADTDICRLFHIIIDEQERCGLCLYEFGMEDNDD